MTETEVVYAVLSVLVLTATLIGNLLIRNSSNNPVSTVLWTRYRLLMNLSMLFIGVIVLFQISDLAIHFGLLPASAKDALLPLLGIPMAILSVAILVVGGRALFGLLKPSS